MVLAMLKDVDYLLIAKPVAFNHLGIRRDCAISCRSLVVLSEGHDLCCFCDKEKCA